jgi:hypothetical protein
MDAQHGKLPYIHGNKRDIKVIKWLRPSSQVFFHTRVAAIFSKLYIDFSFTSVTYKNV